MRDIPYPIIIDYVLKYKDEKSPDELNANGFWFIHRNSILSHFELVNRSKSSIDRNKKNETVTRIE